MSKGEGGCSLNMVAAEVRYNFKLEYAGGLHCVCVRVCVMVFSVNQGIDKG